MKAAAAAFASNAANGNLCRAQLSFLGAWTAEWAFTVGLGIVAYRNGGATAVGLVGLLRMLPSAVIAPWQLRSQIGDAGNEFLLRSQRSAASQPRRLELSSPSTAQW